MKRVNKFSALLLLVVFSLMGCGTTKSADAPAPTDQNCTAAEGEGTFSSIQKNILGPRCLSCHPDQINGNGGFGADTYSDVVTVVKAGNATGSTLYKMVTVGGMPQEGGSLSTQEVADICSWIQAGAPNN